MTAKFSRISLVYFFLLLLLLVVYFFNISFPTFFLKFLAILISILTIYWAKKRMKWFHSFLLFVFSFSLFYFSRVLLDLFLLDDLASISLYKYYTVSDEILSKSLLILLISFISVCLSFSYFHCSHKPYRYPKETKNILLRYRNFFFWGILALLPGAILKMKYDISFVSIESYLGIYKEFTSAPILYRFSWYFLILLIPIVVSLKNSKREALLILGTYLLISLLDSFKGSRGALLKPLAFCCWYYYRFYTKKDLNISKAFIISVGLVILMQAYLLFRLRISLDWEKFKLIMPLFFSQQGVSFTVLPLFFDFQNDIVNGSRLYILYPLTSTFIRLFSAYGKDGHSFEYMFNTQALDHKLMYAINPSAYLEGFGIGSSYVLELYILGGVVTVILGSLILGYLINKFEVIVVQKSYMLIFSVVWIEHLVWMSRGSYFPELTKIAFPFLLYHVFKFYSKIK